MSDHNMSEKTCRVVLSVEPRLLREMLRHVIIKTPGLQLVGETVGKTLPTVIEQVDAQWVIVSLLPGGELPERAGALLVTHPTVAILAVAADGSQWKLKWLETYEELLEEGLSLDELIQILRQGGPVSEEPGPCADMGLAVDGTGCRPGDKPAERA